MNFIPLVQAPAGSSKEDLWFVFKGQDLLVAAEGEIVKIPRFQQLQEEKLVPERHLYLGKIDELNCYSAEIADDIEIPGSLVLLSMRSLLNKFTSEDFLLAGRAYQIIEWERNHQYCGRCSTKTISKEDERAKLCPKCGLVNYPRISPAVIVAVTRGDKILLANSGRFANKMYSVLAGFVEAGETFEECVKREINEEVNIEVKNIRYFGSQPWPFPNSLMVGFTAEYAGGELKPDGNEILDARWFGADELPPIPGPWSIARRLIDWFTEVYKKV